MLRYGMTMVQWGYTVGYEIRKHAMTSWVFAYSFASRDNGGLGVGWASRHFTFGLFACSNEDVKVIEFDCEMCEFEI
jgi:hypothetical protein